MENSASARLHHGPPLVSTARLAAPTLCSLRLAAQLQVQQRRYSPYPTLAPLSRPAQSLPPHSPPQPSRTPRPLHSPPPASATSVMFSPLAQQPSAASS